MKKILEWIKNNKATMIVSVVAVLEAIGLIVEEVLKLVK